MWTLYIRVPTRGWKLVRGFKYQSNATRYQRGFLPLETKLLRPNGEEYRHVKA